MRLPLRLMAMRVLLIQHFKQDSISASGVTTMYVNEDIPVIAMHTYLQNNELNCRFTKCTLVHPIVDPGILGGTPQLNQKMVPEMSHSRTHVLEKYFLFIVIL